jgi:hypothetical protein
MSDKLSYKFVERAYPHAQIEAAFVRVFDVPPERVRYMRSRVKHLMQLGLPESKPGRGARVHYDYDVILRWLFALLLQDAGGAPAGSVKGVHFLWGRESTAKWIERAVDAESATNPVYMTLRPNFADAAWDDKAPQKWIGFRRRRDPRLLRIKGNDDDMLRRFLEEADRDGVWACVRNLTRDLEILRNALEPDSDGSDSAPNADEAESA